LPSRVVAEVVNAVKVAADNLVLLAVVPPVSRNSSETRKSVKCWNSLRNKIFRLE
jgi:hypothetical protein